MNHGVQRARRRGRGSGRLWGAVCLLGVWSLGILGTHSQAAAAGWRPKESADQPWRVQSFLEDAGLAQRAIFNLAVTTNAVGGGWTLWFATSDGLREYDGYQWRRHGREQGLPSDFVRSVLVTRAGELWVGTDRGAGVYDGQGFRTHGSEAGLAGVNVRRMVEDTDGTVWFCSDRWPDSGTPGGLSSWHAGVWKRYGSAEGLSSDYIGNFHRSRDGRAFVATWDGLFEQLEGRWTPVRITDPKPWDRWSVTTFAEVPGLGLAFSNGDLFWWGESGWTRQSQSQPQDLRPRDAITATTDGALVALGKMPTGRIRFMEWVSGAWVPMSAEFGHSSTYAIDLKEAPDGGIWAMGTDCLVHWTRRGGEWRQFAGVPSPRWVDARGAIWFQTPKGLGGAGSEAVRRGAEGDWEREPEPMDGLVRGTEGAIWGWTRDRVVRWEGGERTEYGMEQVGLATNRVVKVDGVGGVWVVGSEAGGASAVAQFQGGPWQGRSVTGRVGQRVTEIVPDPGGGLWLAMDDGVMTEATLRWVGGAREEAIVVPKEILDVNALRLHVDRRRSVWLFGRTGLFRWRLGESRAWEEISGLPGRQVVDCLERGDDLWFACTGHLGGSSGLAGFRDGTWVTHQVETRGALSVASGGELLWPGDGCFFVLGSEPGSIPVRVSLPMKVMATRVLKDRQGAYWVGTSEGVLRFLSGEVAPKTLVSGVDRLTRGDELTLVAEGVKAYRPRGYRKDYRFLWRVDDGEWSEPRQQTEFRLETAAMGPGLHGVEVRAMDSGGNVAGSSARWTFEVLPVPLQHHRWFLTGVGMTMAALSGLAALAVTAKRRLAGHAQVLEQRVKERTAALERDVARRQAAEVEAREGRDRLWKVFEASPSMIVITSYPEGRILQVNRRSIDVLGYGPGEVEGRTGRELGIWASLEQRRAIMDDLGRGVPIQNREVQLVAKAGRIHSVLLSADQIEFGGRPAVLFTATDITERVRLERRRATEHAVARVMAEADSLAEAGPAILRSLCEADGWRYGELWEVDPSEGQLRCEAHWHGPGDQYEDLVVQGREQRFGAGEGLPGLVWQAESGVFMLDLVEDERFRRGEAARRAGLVSGLGYPCRAGGKVNGVVVLMTDRPLGPARDLGEVLGVIGIQIGQFILRMRTREELQRFVAVSPAVLYMMRIGSSGLEPFWVSPNLTTLTGHSLSEARDAEWWRRNVHAEDVRRVSEAQPDHYDIEHQVLEFRFRRADGNYIWLRDEKRLLRDENGLPSEVVGTLSDVSERVALEARLLQAQKMEAIGLLSGGIAHDFNNILGAILGNAQLAKMDVPADHCVRESLDGILQAAQRAKGLVRQILEFARQETRNLKRTQLGPVVEQAVRMLRKPLPAGVELRVLVAPDVPEVMADAGQFQQIVLNLGTNAWQALEGKPGTVEVRVDPCEVDAGLVARHPELRVGRYARLQIRDTGIGMSRETQERIFEPFFTTRPLGEGTGLGLSVVHGLVKAHGGTVMVTSAPGEGSVFDLYLPAVAETPPKTVVVPVRSGSKVLNESVLLVDDKELITRSCSRALERLGYRVRAFNDGASALAEFHDRPDDFDVVITDLSMPGISGIEIARLIQKRRPGLPVILSSGLVPDHIQREFEAVGIRQLLRKPFTFDELGEAVSQALAGKPDESKATHA